MPMPGFEWMEEAAGRDVRTARDGNFVLANGQEDCPAPGGSPQLPPRGPDGGSIPFTRLVFPPRIEKLNVSQDFNVNSYQLILPAGNGQTIDLPGFNCPQGMVGWLQQTFLYVLLPTAQAQASWCIRINGMPVPGFDNMQNPPGIANFLFLGEDDLRIRIPQGSYVDVRVTNINTGVAGPWTVGAGLAGWFHPEQAEERAYGAGNFL